MISTKYQDGRSCMTFVICEVQWRSQYRGKGEQSATPDSEKFAKNWEKSGKKRKNREKSGKKQGKKRKNGKKRQKSGRFFHLAPPDRKGWLCYW